MSSISPVFDPSAPFPPYDPGQDFPIDVPPEGPSIGQPAPLTIPQSPSTELPQPDEDGLPEDFPTSPQPDPTVQNDSPDTGTVIADAQDAGDAADAGSDGRSGDGEVARTMALPDHDSEKRRFGWRQ